MTKKFNKITLFRIFESQRIKLKINHLGLLEFFNRTNVIAGLIENLKKKKIPSPQKKGKEKIRLLPVVSLEENTQNTIIFTHC